MKQKAIRQGCRTYPLRIRRLTVMKLKSSHAPFKGANRGRRNRGSRNPDHQSGARQSDGLCRQYLSRVIINGDCTLGFRSKLYGAGRRYRLEGSPRYHSGNAIGSNEANARLFEHHTQRHGREGCVRRCRRLVHPKPQTQIAVINQRLYTTLAVNRFHQAIVGQYRSLAAQVLVAGVMAP